MQSNTDIHGFIKSAAIRVYKSALSAFQQKIMTQKEQLQLGKDYPDDTPQDGMSTHKVNPPLVSVPGRRQSHPGRGGEH